MKKILSTGLIVALVVISIIPFQPQKISAGEMSLQDGSVQNIDGIDYRVEKSDTIVQYGEDADGVSYKVTIDEYLLIPVNAEEQTLNSFSRGLFPEYPVGTQKYFHFDFTNEELGFIGSGGSFLSDVGKAYITRVVTETLVAQLGTTLLGGLAVAATISSIVAGINEVLGNNGLALDVWATYGSVYMHAGGYYMYGWEINKYDAYAY